MSAATAARGHLLLSGEPARLRLEGRRRLVFDADDCRRERPGATVRGAEQAPPSNERQVALTALSTNCTILEEGGGGYSPPRISGHAWRFSASSSRSRITARGAPRV